MSWLENVEAHKKNDELLRNKNYETDCIHNRLESENKSVITSYKINSTSSGPNYPSSQSICSRYLNTPASRCDFQNSSSNKKVESSINQKRSIGMKATFKESLAKNLCDELHKTVHKNNRSDKSTYCRPLIKLYNEQFLYKTIEKNTKLKKLVKELMIARQREKEMENWNNYINELRKKHSNDTKMRCTTSLQYVPEGFVAPGIIEDYYNTKFTWKQSSPCQNLLQDLYNADNNFYTRYPFNDYYESTNKDSTLTKKYAPFETHPFCYPTSSQGRIIMLERERQKRLEKRMHKPFCSTIDEKNKFDSSVSTEGNCFNKINRKKFCSGKGAFVLKSRGSNIMLETSSTQTKNHLTLTNEDRVLQKVSQLVSKQICTDELYEVGRPQEYAKSTENVWKQTSLACIEDKLDNLINSINNFIVEMKTKKYPRLNKHFNLTVKPQKENVNITKSDSYGIAKKEKIVCGLEYSSSQSTRYSSKVSFDRIKHMEENISKLNDIILKEIGRSKLNTLKDSSVGERYYPCSVQISVTIPTKEISTEVTRSLSKARYNIGNNENVIEEINTPIREDRRIAIAVNTDPISLLAFLKVSSEEILRRLLSYVPSIDYYYYLSRLQSSQSKAMESQFVCNICGAVFTKPSQLSDHIQKHELGKTRDCCVCRHVLDMPRRRSSLFKCRYCGQRFTRAFCCELHQQSCATRLGVPHDIASSLMLLR